MTESPYRENTSPPLLPLAGARVHALQREGSSANLALAAVWGGTMLFVMMLSVLLEGRVPDAVLPWIAPPFVVAGLVGAWLAHRRISTGGSRWRLHVAGERFVLERATPPAAFDLARVPVRAARYEYSFRGGRGALPTVAIDLDDGTSLVVSGPVGVGWQNLGDEAAFAELGLRDAPRKAPERSRAPDVRLDDAHAFQALSAAAAR